ncbi:MAG TPA: hypothetical protein DCP55_00295 [Chitinophagaceae bacterium]|nr:hypothetical protein [Chitinophagaceae bacterium]
MDAVLKLRSLFVRLKFRIWRVYKLFDEIEFASAVKLLLYMRLLILGIKKESENLIRVKVNSVSLQIPQNKVAIRIFWSTFVFKYHLPLNPGSEPQLILDFGSNIGLTCFDYSLRFPKAKIIGYEIDLKNFEFARKLNQNNPQVSILHLGVSDKSEWMYYDSSVDSDAYSLIEDKFIDERSVKVRVESVSEIFASFDKIDLVKVDIEGTELSILRSLNPIHVEHVKEIVIEIHKKFELEEIRSILERLGFHVENHEEHWSALRAIKLL